jgi:hypothetical protein
MGEFIFLKRKLLAKTASRPRQLKSYLLPGKILHFKKENMKYLKIISLVCLVVFAIQACNKDNSDPVEEDRITMVIDGKNYKSTLVENFESHVDTSEWNLYPGGTLEIDTVNTFNGNSTLKLISTDNCFHLEKIEGIDVNKDKVYVIHFNYKLPITTIEELNNGFGWTCMGPYRIEIKQGQDILLSEWCAEIDSWTEKYFYFQPLNNVPVKIEFLVGTKKGLWLDDLLILEEY